MFGFENVMKEESEKLSLSFILLDTMHAKMSASWLVKSLSTYFKRSAEMWN